MVSRKQVRQEILRILKARHEGVRRTQALASEIGCLRASASRAVNQLERDGLVARKHGRWVLTEEGERQAGHQVRRTAGMSGEQVEGRMRALSPGGQESLRKYLQGEITPQQLADELEGEDRAQWERTEGGRAGAADPDPSAGYRAP